MYFVFRWRPPLHPSRPWDLPLSPPAVPRPFRPPSSPLFPSLLPLWVRARDCAALLALWPPGYPRLGIAALPLPLDHPPLLYYVLPGRWAHRCRHLGHPSVCSGRHQKAAPIYCEWDSHNFPLMGFPKAVLARVMHPYPPPPAAFNGTLSPVMWHIDIRRLCRCSLVQHPLFSARRNGPYRPPFLARRCFAGHRLSLAGMPLIREACPARPAKVTPAPPRWPHPPLPATLTPCHLRRGSALPVLPAPAGSSSAVRPGLPGFDSG